MHRLVLEPLATRRLTIHDADGKPIAGAALPRVVQTEQTSYLGITVPDGWLERFSGMTDQHGTAAMPSLSRNFDVRAARVSVPGRGTDVLLLPYSKGKDDVTLTLSRAGGVDTRIRDESGTPVPATGRAVGALGRSAG